MTRRNRIADRFGVRRSQGRTSLIFYITAGDPSLDQTVEMLHGLVAGGADLIELGYPFCDPILDGPVIRLANRRALDAGGSLDATLEIVRLFRRRDPDTPVILMGYANPIMSRGKQILAEAANAGVDGLIIPDLPLREASDMLSSISTAGLVLIPLVPPRDIVDADLLAATGIGGFTYCIAQAGPTGGALTDEASVRQSVARCRALSPLPVAVGFGISTPRLAAALAPSTDGIIVGSALTDQIQQLTQSGHDAGILLSKLTEFAGGFRQAIDAV